MATDPDRQSNGRPPLRRRRTLSEPPGGIHAAFQVGWALATSVPVIAKATELADRPSSSAALAIIQVTGVWAVGAGFAWALRVAALSTCGRWGARTRERVREAGRRREVER